MSATTVSLAFATETKLDVELRAPLGLPGKVLLSIGDEVFALTVADAVRLATALEEVGDSAREAARAAACPCAQSMGCLCAAHANGAAPTQPCNATEVL